MKLENLCIYVQNYSEWIELQNYMFSQNIFWVGKNYDTIITKIMDNDLIFPRNMLFYFNDDKNRWCIANVGNTEKGSLLNEDEYKEVKAIEILRRNKLNNINTLSV